MISKEVQVAGLDPAPGTEVELSGKDLQPVTSDYSDIKVLMYHRIVGDNEHLADTRWNVSETQLSKHLDLLSKWGFTCVSFGDYVLHLDGRLALPRKPVILTFDDGYDEVYWRAFPILKSHGVRATLFVLGDRSIRSNTWDEAAGAEKARLLESAKILELHKSGFEIGSHSLTHADLTTLSAADAWDEISGSKAALEDLIHAPVLSFAYPYGATSLLLQRMVQNAGYRLGCGTYSGPPEFQNDIFNIRRILISRTTSVFDFALKLLTPYKHYAWLRWKAGQALSVGRNKHDPHPLIRPSEPVHNRENAEGTRLDT